VDKLPFLKSEYNKITILFLTDIFPQRVYTGLLSSFSAELELGVPMRVLAGEMVIEFGGIQKTCTLRSECKKCGGYSAGMELRSRPTL